LKNEFDFRSDGVDIHGLKNEFDFRSDGVDIHGLKNEFDFRSDGVDIHGLDVEAHGRVPLHPIPINNHPIPVNNDSIPINNDSIPHNHYPQSAANQRIQSTNDSKQTIPLKTNDNPTIESIYNATIKKKRNPPIRLPKSISSFIAGFKSAVNTQIDNFIDEQKLPVRKFNRKNHFFQPNYYDRIIRNEIEHFFISRYITNNPMHWNNDKLHE
jgi:hypothetical protein